MKAATLNEIKRELNTVEPERLLELGMRLAKFKKENKELLTYLLFESQNESAYIENVKHEIDDLFKELPSGNLYYVKKSLRKILRMVNRQVKYSGLRHTEVALRIHFCLGVKRARINLEKSTVLANLYEQQIKKIYAAIATLHTDVQYDFEGELSDLNINKS